jgi:hypothetical protein
MSGVHSVGGQGMPELPDIQDDEPAAGPAADGGSSAAQSFVPGQPSPQFQAQMQMDMSMSAMLKQYGVDLPGNSPAQAPPAASAPAGAPATPTKTPAGPASHAPTPSSAPPSGPSHPSAPAHPKGPVHTQGPSGPAHTQGPSGPSATKGPQAPASPELDPVRTGKQLLGPGAQGPAVKSLQQQLNKLGLGPVPEDGKLDAKTEAAIKKLQQASGCHVDGIVGPETMAVLDKAAGLKPNAAAAQMHAKLHPELANKPAGPGGKPTDTWPTLTLPPASQKHPAPSPLHPQGHPPTPPHTTPSSTPPSAPATKKGPHSA